MQNDNEYVVKDVYLFFDGEIRHASVLIRDGMIFKIAKDPVIASIPEEYDRIIMRKNNSIIVPAIIDCQSWIDGINTYYDLQKLQTTLFEGGICRSSFSFANIPSRVSWLDIARKINKIFQNSVVFGPKDYINRWKKNRDIGKIETLGIYPSQSKYLLAYPIYFNYEEKKEIESLQSLSKEAIIHSNLTEDQILLGSTLLASKNRIPFLFSLLFDNKNRVGNSLPLRSRKVRYELLKSFQGTIAIGHGIEDPCFPGIEIGGFSLPIILSLFSDDISKLGNIENGSRDFVFIKKGGVRDLITTEEKLPLCITTPKYRVEATFVDGHPVFQA